MKSGIEIYFGTQPMRNDQQRITDGIIITKVDIKLDSRYLH